MTAFDRFEQEKQKYAERREALDKDFDWTQKQLEKIRALNEVLLKKQEELVSQMNKVADLFTRLERDGFDFLHGFKVVGNIEFWKTLLDDENLDDSKLSEAETRELEKWQYVSEESESRYWSLIFDSDTNDFTPLSKILMANSISKSWIFDLPDENEVKLCSFLIHFYEHISLVSFFDLLDCKEDFFPHVSVEINCDTVELEDIEIQRLSQRRQRNESSVALILENRKLALNDNFKWSEENIQKMFAVNAIVWKKYDQMEQNIKRLASVFRELSKTDPFFEPWDIDAELRYQSKKPTDIASVEMQKLLSQHTLMFGMNLRLNANIPEEAFRDDINRDEHLNWNFEVYAWHFNEEQKKVRFNYFMHTVFIDDHTFSFEDLVRMEEDGFFPRYEITF